MKFENGEITLSLADFIVIASVNWAVISMLVYLTLTYFQVGCYEK